MAEPEAKDGSATAESAGDKRATAAVPPMRGGEDGDVHRPATADGSDELWRLRERLARDTPLRAGIAVLVVAFGGFTAWASLMPLTEGVVGSGQVVVESAHKTVQHLEGGIIERLHVREGSEVKAGDLLIELSGTQARAELDLLESRYSGLLAELNRLEAERLGSREISFAEELLDRRAEPRIADMLAMQLDLFEVRRRRYLGQIKILRHRIGQFQEKIRGLEAGREARVRGQALLKKEIERLRSLFEHQLVDEREIIGREREYERNVGEIAGLAAEVAGTRVAIGETRQEIIQLEHTTRTEVANRITEARQERFEIRERLVAARDVLRRTRIVAPQHGKVIGLEVHTRGGVIPPASPILNIVPSEERLMVEAQVRPTDVDNVHPGQQARLRFTAFTQRNTPEVSGLVERVSADAFQDRETKETYYVARIRVPEEQLARLGDVVLGPGMPVDVMFTGGERTALQYLSAPLASILEKALVEE